MAETFVFTSQGVPLLFAGDEIMRDKKGVSNSYNSSDEINKICWKNKTSYRDVFDYVKSLIALRKEHPAFRMGEANLVRKHMEFLPVTGNNLIAFVFKDNANGDTWRNIIVAFNARSKNAKVTIPDGNYTIICKKGKINLKGMGKIKGSSILVPPRSAMIIHE